MKKKKTPEFDLKKHKGWKTAVPKSVNRTGNCPGLIMGTKEYIRYVLAHLPEEYEIID